MLIKNAGINYHDYSTRHLVFGEITATRNMNHVYAISNLIDNVIQILFLPLRQMIIADYIYIFCIKYTSEVPCIVESINVMISRG